jgi:hypothetical protein
MATLVFWQVALRRGRIRAEHRCKLLATRRTVEKKIESRMIFQENHVQYCKYVLKEQPSTW